MKLLNEPTEASSSNEGIDGHERAVGHDQVEIRIALPQIDGMQYSVGDAGSVEGLGDSAYELSSSRGDSTHGLRPARSTAVLMAKAPLVVA
jgi:hypothetical protein